MLAIDVEYDGPDSAEIKQSIRTETDAVLKKLAKMLQRGIRKSSLVPRDTGTLAAGHVIDYNKIDGLVVLNRVSYAEAVNNRQRYPRGGSNPNYRYVQRYLLRNYNRLLKKANAAVKSDGDS